MSRRALGGWAELWRRVVFSVLISNTGGHLRNHGFLCEIGRGWRLSPACDPSPVPTEVGLRVRTACIDEFDGTASPDQALATAEYRGPRARNRREGLRAREERRSPGGERSPRALAGPDGESIAWSRRPGTRTSRGLSGAFDALRPEGRHSGLQVSAPLRRSANDRRTFGRRPEDASPQMLRTSRSPTLTRCPAAMRPCRAADAGRRRRGGRVRTLRLLVLP